MLVLPGSFVVNHHCIIPILCTHYQVQCCFTSTETVGLLRTGSQGRPPRLLHNTMLIYIYIDIDIEIEIYIERDIYINMVCIYILLNAILLGQKHNLRIFGRGNPLFKRLQNNT